MTRFTVLDCEQRSDEWRSARLGRLTASRAADMLATIRSGEAAARRNLRVQLMLERITGRSMERDYQSPAMLDGIAREADALRRYEAVAGVLVRRTGFLLHDELMLGASLDGHLGDFDVVVEAKSPIPATHLEYLRSGVVPYEYLQQITHQLYVSGARLAHFASYQPDFPERLQLLIREVKRDEKAIEAYDKAARVFLAEVDRECESLATLANVGAQLERAVAVA